MSPFSWDSYKDELEFNGWEGIKYSRTAEEGCVSQTKFQKLAKEIMDISCFIKFSNRDFVGQCLVLHLIAK